MTEKSVTTYAWISGLIIIRTLFHCTLGVQLLEGHWLWKLWLRTTQVAWDSDSWAQGWIGSTMRPGIGSTRRWTHASLLAKLLDGRMNRNGAPFCSVISFMPAKPSSADFLQTTTTDGFAVTMILLSSSCRHGKGFGVICRQLFLLRGTDKYKKSWDVCYYLIYSTTRYVTVFWCFVCAGCIETLVQLASETKTFAKKTNNHLEAPSVTLTVLAPLEASTNHT